MYTAVCVKECPSYDPASPPTQLKVDYMPTTTNEAQTDNIIFDAQQTNVAAATKAGLKILLSNTKGFYKQCFLEAASDNEN